VTNASELLRGAALHGPIRQFDHMTKLTLNPAAMKST
jgi:hypothetical protein